MIHVTPIKQTAEIRTYMMTKIYWIDIIVELKMAQLQSWKKKKSKTLIRLGGFPGWPESSLDAQPFCWFCHVAAQIFRVHRTNTDIEVNIFHKELICDLCFVYSFWRKSLGLVYWCKRMPTFTLAWSPFLTRVRVGNDFAERWLG